MKWVPGENGTMVAIAVGSTAGKERREVVATFHPEGNDAEARKLLSRLSMQGEKVVVMPDEKTAEPVVLPGVKIETVTMAAPGQMLAPTVIKPTEATEKIAPRAEPKTENNTAVPNAKTETAMQIPNEAVESAGAMNRTVEPMPTITTASAMPEQQVQQAMAMVGEHPAPALDEASDQLSAMPSDHGLNEKSMANGQMDPPQRPTVERFVTAAETPSAMPS